MFIPILIFVLVTINVIFAGHIFYLHRHIKNLVATNSICLKELSNGVDDLLLALHGPLDKDN